MRPSAPTLATPQPPHKGELASVAASAADHYKQDLVEELRRATLGDYEILTQLGEGGMATVYLAHDIQLDRKVAIKVMSPALLSGQGMVERFKLEARTAAKLSHPHIIPIFAVKEVGKMLFFVMKFVEGRPLDSIIKQLGKVPLPMVMTIMTKVGEALGYAHRNGVVHRDIKPANIMIDVEGLPVVTDFGIAKVADHQGLTMTGATIGTPTYMSPEQCTSGEITGASDQYSLGIVAYEMLTGTAPFHADSLMTIMYMHCNEEPQAVTELRADCPPALRDAVLRMLEKAPADRWSSMEEMVAAVGGATTLAFDDPIRTQLVGLALAGESHKAMERISTPRSPMPMLDRDGPASPAATVKTPASATVPEGSPRKGGSKLWLGIGGTVIVGAAIALGILQPWATSDPVGGAVPPAAVAAPVTDLTVTPMTATLQVGGAPQLLTAQALDSSGAPATTDIQWGTNDPGVATVSENGSVSPVAPGPAVITVKAGAATTNVSITVIAAPLEVDDPGPGGPQPAAVASLRLRGGQDRPEVGTRFQLQATPLDNGGTALSGRTVTWESSAPLVASVDVVGLVSAHAEGPATITARSGSVFSAYPLRVIPEAVTRVTLQGGPVSPLGVGADVTLTAVATGSSGRPLSGRQEIWQSTNPSAATVQGGVVQAIGPGRTDISVSIEGVRATVALTVEAAAVVQPTISPRDAVTAVVMSYAEALQLKDFNGLREIFPTQPAEQLRVLQQGLEPIEQLAVELTIQEINIAADIAIVTAQQRYFEGGARNLLTEGSLMLRLRLGSDGVWRITDIE